MAYEFSQHGFEFVENVISIELLDECRLSLDLLNTDQKLGGVRNIGSKVPAIQKLITSPAINVVVAKYIGDKFQLVRAISFDKTVKNNWGVFWHQDKTVSVSQRFERKGWNNWTNKDGVPHVQPPVEVLESMVTLRVHLDKTTRENGCLRVIASSHAEGILSQKAVDRMVNQKKIIDCELSAGSVLVMRPHLIHGSRKALHPSSRKVVHMEFSNYALPDGIRWY